MVLAALLAQAGATGASAGAGGGAAGTVAPLDLPSIRYLTIGPPLVLIVGALVLLSVSSLFVARLPRGLAALWTVGTGLAATVAAGLLWRDVRDHGAATAVAGMVSADGFSVFFMLLLGGIVAVGALLAEDYLRREGLDGPEFYVLALLSAAGGMLMAEANDLLVVFLGLEILSIPLYVMAGLHRRRAESGEAAMKYFVLGAFSSAFLLYGIALVYGATGSTNLTEIASFLADNVLVHNGVLLAGLVLLVVGFGFKVSAVPFHTWTPDVYQGAPSPATGFMAAAAKAAGFAAFLRVFMSTFQVLQRDWTPLVWALAVLTLVAGSVLAVVQTDIKRMLAYSSISHAGYVLVGLETASKAGVTGALFYLAAYAFMVLGSFAIVTLIGRRGDEQHSLEAYRGLASRRPGLALAFTVFLLAQAGVPFTSGFLAKFYVISAAVAERSYVLAVIAMLAAAIAAFFYLRVVVLMYAGEEGSADAPARIPVPASAGAALVLTLAFTLVVGVYWSPVYDLARHATLLFGTRS